MFVIKGEDFRMEQEKTTPLFNLKLLTIVNKGKSNERFEMKLDGYSMPFKSCIQRVIAKRLSERDVIVSLNGGIQLYVEEIDKLINSEVTIEHIEHTEEEVEDDNENS